MLDSKLLKPRKSTNKCKLFINGDWNDADYITEDTSLSIDEMKELLPYFSILLDLFKFDNEYRRKTRDYRIDIRDEFNNALEFYLEQNENFYPKLLELKKNKEILSDRLIDLDEDNFEDVRWLLGEPIVNFTQSIIDDSIFYNKNAMNVQQIQQFLNSQVGQCDTWGTGPSGRNDGRTAAQFAASQNSSYWHRPPYVCINNYHENPNTGETSFEKGGGAFEGGISAAQIIYDAAQKYGINPQVLIVLLKKEDERGEIKKSVIAVFLTCLIVGFYDGFFGPGTGSIFIIALFVINKLSLLQASATSKIFNFASNIGGIRRFLDSGENGVPNRNPDDFGEFVGQPFRQPPCY